MQLTDPANFSKLDTADVYHSILSLRDQVEQSWRETDGVVFSEPYSSCDRIVVAGMGGSTLGAHIVKSLFESQLRVPVEIINDYSLPAYVSRRTLVIVISYSGTTEEVFSALEDASGKGALVIGITSGSVLANLLREQKFPVYQFDPRVNVSRQPRLGIGFIVGSLIRIFFKLGYFISFSDEELKSSLGIFSSVEGRFGVSVEESRNEAMKTALFLKGYPAFVITSGFLAGNAHTISNQINESGKQFCTYFLVPELNHHLMEGLTYPKTLHSFIKVLFLDSSFFEERIKTRFAVTKEVLEKLDISYVNFSSSANSLLSTAFEILAFGAFVSYYLAILNDVDPSKIPHVDFFKEKLAAR